MKPVEAFQVAELPKAGLVGRLLGRVSREAVFVQIRNLLATTPFERISPADVAGILAQRKLLPRDATTDLILIFEQAVYISCADDELSPADRRSLEAIATAFELSADESRDAIARAIRGIYEAKLSAALADRVFSPQDRERLERLSTGLGLSDAQCRPLFNAAALKAVTTAYERALVDGRLGSAEDEQIVALATALNANITLGDHTKRIVERARLLGRIDEGQLPVVAVPLMLGRGEVCHFAARSVTQSEMRVVTKRINYSGPSASIRIIKDIRWRMGSVSVQRVTQDVLTKIDAGDFYVTNKKVFFQGLRKNTSIALSKIVSFKVYKDGIEIDKQTGKDFYCIGEGDWELAGACLDAAVTLGR